MSRSDQVEDFIEVLARYARIRDRLAATRLRTPDGIVETAAYQCLFRLADKPSRSGELAEALFADPSTISRHVAHLVRLGYVRREADPQDGRATILVATDSGRERVAALRQRRGEELKSLMADWPDDDIDTLIRLMGRFVDSAEDALTCAPAERQPS
jgi:DNA-binding MarR family transcriptional regulator